jgi:hypothetical protein
MGRIINTGRHLPRATIGDVFELWGNRKKLVERPILRQSRRDGTVLYGAYAVNQLVHPSLRRSTYDFDVKSPRPRHHAVELERHIDRGVNADLMYVEQTSYPLRGKKKRLFRVKSRLNEVVEADYSRMPVGMRFVVRGGVRYEPLSMAQKKNVHMIRNPQYGRGFNAVIDRSRINQNRFIKKRRRWF